MAIITLTSDLGLKDYNVAAVKGFIYSLLPNTTIVDISHQITPFNIAEASFIIRNCYHEFPPRTIHLVSVESDNDRSEDYLCALFKNQYIIARDNGLISLVTDAKPDKLIRITPKSRSDLLFPLKHIMAKAACKLAIAFNEYDLGTLVKDYNTTTNLAPIIEKNIIRGTIIYIDNYGNAITNIGRGHFERFEPEQRFNIYFGSGYSINRMCLLYSDVPEGEILCLISNTGLMQISINKGNAADLLGLKIKGKILVEFT